MLAAIAELAGAEQTAVQPASTEPEAQDSAERRQVTVMFSDLLLRLLPTGAVAGWGLHPLESAAFSRRTPTTDSRSAANKFHHSITSSACASSKTGMLRPRALAVLRLITSSTLVLCWIGRSAGLAPLRIFPM